MKKSRFLSVLLTICLLVSFVPVLEHDARAAAPTLLRVGDVDALTTNSGSGWSYDGNGTLTLTNAVITGSESSSEYTYAVIYCKGDLTIRLPEGTSSSVTGDPEPAVGDDTYNNFVIEVEGSLTITGGGTLEVTGVKAGNIINPVYSSGDLTISGSTVITHAGTSKESANGIVITGKLTVENSTITINGGVATSEERGTTAGISAASAEITDSEITITCQSAPMMSAGIYIADGSLNVADSTLAATAGQAQMSLGMMIGSLTVSGASEVTATGADGSAMSMGVLAPSGVTVSGGALTATGGTASAMSCAIGNGSSGGGPLTVGSDAELTLRYDPNAPVGAICGVLTNDGDKTMYFNGAQVNGAALDSLAVGASTEGDVTAPGGSFAVSYTAPPAAPEPETPSDDPTDPTDPMRGNVYGQYVADGGEIEVISVDIEWGSMRFAYSSEAVQIWIPEEHDYSGEPATGWTPLDKNGDLLTITNHSNVDVEITVSEDIQNAGVSDIEFEKVDAGIDYAGDYVLQAGVENQYENADYLMLAVKPVGSLQSSETDIDTIAEITVTIEKYE